MRAGAGLFRALPKRPADQMVHQGAEINDLAAVIGPTIRQPSYQVGDLGIPFLPRHHGAGPFQGR